MLKSIKCKFWSIVWSHSFLLLLFSSVLSLCYLLKHHILVLLLAHFSLIVFIEWSWCPMILVQLCSTKNVVNLRHLSFWHHKWTLLVRQCTNCIVFKITIHICGNESVLGPVSRILINVIFHHVLFSFLINLRLSSLINYLLLLLFVVYTLILYLYSLDRLTLGLVLIYIWNLCHVYLFQPIGWVAKNCHLLVIPIRVADLIIETSVPALTWLSWFLCILSRLVYIIIVILLIIVSLESTPSYEECVSILLRLLLLPLVGRLDVTLLVRYTNVINLLHSFWLRVVDIVFKRRGPLVHFGRFYGCLTTVSVGIL